MPIKRRTSLPDASANYEEAPTGLSIVAREKKPLPEVTKTVVYDDPADIRRLGQVALALGYNSTDPDFNAADYVKLLRTPFDTKNPQERRYRNRVKNRATAITAACIVCQGARKLVTECAAVSCPLWAFRFGSDPFRGNRK